MIEFILVIAIVLILILLQGFFSGSEIALVNSDKSKLSINAKMGKRGSILALKILERPEKALTTTLIGTNVSLVLLTGLFTSFMIAWFGENGDVFAVLILTPLVLIFGEIVPKSVFQQHSDIIAPKIAYPLYVLSLILYPVVLLFSITSGLVVKVIGGNRSGAGIFTVREQLRTLLESTGGGNIDSPIDQLRIKNVVRFGELSAGDLMSPASEMAALNANTTISKAIKIIQEKGYLHVPVYEGKKSNVVGMLSLTAWQLVETDVSKESVSSVMEKALFIPSVQSVAELLPMLQNRSDQSAVVVDEFGSYVGYISTEMILESIVGSIQPVHVTKLTKESSKPSYRVLDNDVYIFDARLSINDVNEVLAISLSTFLAHTIGGFITNRLRHLPSKGDSVTESGFIFTVEDVSDRAVLSVWVQRVE